ncbi:MAG: NUDIX hydrolase [Planctomycetota bacterium]|jgi:ADP-ribose pyrophosphatase YjhB (NUDIX family)
MIPVPRYCSACSAELVTKVPPLDNRERYVCPKCGHIHYVQPKVAAGTIPERDGRIVLVKRAVEPRKGFWSFPCGFMEIDEDLPGTAKRETEEETGLPVELDGHLGTYSYADSIHGGSIVIAAYFARIADGELKPGDDVCEAKFVRPEEINWDELAFRSTRDALRDWLKARGHA